MMAHVTLSFVNENGSAPAGDRYGDAAVLIVGQLCHLQEIGYERVKSKIQNNVPESAYCRALSSVQDVFPLHLNSISLGVLPSKCSRHNTSSRAHALTKIVRNSVVSGYNFFEKHYIMIVCDRKDVLASGCAVARAVSLYSKKSGTYNKSDISVEFLLTGNAPLLSDEELKCIEYCALSVQQAAYIVDAPCNEMGVDTFIKEVQKVARELKIPPPTIIEGEELRQRGFGGLYGVGKAAECPAALVVLSNIREDATSTIAWVGKGIVYDTGGLSLKTKTAMPGMKRDCGGAAGVLGAFRAAVGLGFKANLHAVFCLAENAVGPTATKPDDIHVLYSGRTVEINNTDAEGRLVLADGVYYALKDLNANVILDMATLTGAQGAATGRYHAALLTNDEDWESKALVAGRSSGDLLFPVPYCPELHFTEFTSAVADMKNSVADRGNAQTSCAGLFVGAQLGFDFNGTWIHVDMASPVHNGERATGYGVALLTVLFGEYSENPLLQALAPKVGSSSSANGSNSSPRGNGDRPKIIYAANRTDDTVVKKRKV